jgi:hypothetical protein
VTDEPSPADTAPTPAATAPRQRSEIEVRWRQARNPPPPVLRAVVASLAVATVGGLVLLLFDWLATNGAIPGAEVRGIAGVLYVVVVIMTSCLLTYLWVELPSGSSGVRRRSPWAILLGLFASIPIVYLALVIVFQVLRPLLPGV